MSRDGAAASGSGTLAGATVLQAVPALRDDAIGRGALDLALALLRAGARALVGGGGGPLVGELQALGGEWIEFDFTAAAVRRRRNVEALRALAAAERIDLVHAQGIEIARCAVMARHRGRPRLITSYVGAPPAPSWMAPPQDAMARGDIVIAPSQFAADLIAARHKIRREAVVAIHPGLDTDRFDPARVSLERVQALRSAWRIGPRDRVILAPGRLVPAQGQLTLVDAARLLVNGGLREVVFVLAGDRTADPDYTAAVDRRVVAQGLGPIFRRVAHCPDMPAAYAMADAVAAPAEAPSIFSAVAAEAQAMARAVIVSEIGALPELVLAPPPGAPGPRTGWLVRPGDPDDLAHAIAGLLAAGAAARHEIEAEARWWAETAFAKPQIIAATLAVYGELLAAG
ncbi:MAG TPA: glycosyltransferase [Xanthobacteraceae bacterium]